MQLPTASTHHHSQPMSTVPLHYNSYFSPQASSHSRPIQISIPSRYTSYNNTERVMGLDFEQPSTNNNNHLSSNIESIYYMDFMDDENPPASSSITTQNHRNSMQTESIESALRRAALSPSTGDDKENGTSPSSKTSSSTSDSRKEETSSPTAAAAANARTSEFMRVLGEPGMQNFKRHSSFDDENLINEETESEAGYSGEDDCMSNCGCVHSCIGSPIDFAPHITAATAFDSQPFTRLGFRSIGDIIGYVNVVKSERLEALSELKNAVDKFNDMRQRKNQNLSLNSNVKPTN